MKKLFITSLVIALTHLAFAQGKTAIVRSAISFQVKNMGINTQGTLGGLQADVHFNPADPSTSTLSATVDVNTLNSDNSSRDEHLKNEDFFDVAHYPTITLKSVSLKHKSGNNYTGQFNLTIKNKTRAVEIPFTYTDKGGPAEIKGIFKLNRLDYGVGSDSMILSNEVTVTIDVEFKN